ncbi:MAG: glycosyltransferase family 61 protein [Lachnospiraceae bacterium]|nr:glycosyltransferase family 61 protein [Lachnospiraceae bacterium]
MSAKRIALWGFGAFGKDMECILSHCWKEQYEITAVFDRRYAELGRTPATGLPVRDPATAGEVFRQGVFDELVVTVFDPAQRAGICSALSALGIPVCTITGRSPLKPPEFFRTWEPTRPFPGQGYRRFCFRDQRLEYFGRDGIPFVYDQDGVLNGAYIRGYQRVSDVYCQLYAPDTHMPELELKGDWCLLSGRYGRNYWHFTYESLDRFRLLENSGYTGRYLVYHTPFAEELLRLAGADFSRIVWLEDLQKDTAYHMERLICPLPVKNDLEASAPVLLEVAETVKRNLPPVTKAYPERLFVRRIGSRKLRIDDETLARYGFQTVIPEELTVSEQIRFFEQAKIVLSPHGANSTNSLYMHPGSVLIETFPSSYINPMCAETLRLQDVYYLPLTQQKEPSMAFTDSPDVDYEIRPAILELAMRAAEKLAQ